MHTSELCYCGLKSSKRNVHNDGHGHCKFSMIVTIPWQVSVNLPTMAITIQIRGQTQRKHGSYHYEVVYLQH